MRTLNDVIWYGGTAAFFVFMFISIGGLIWFDMPTNAPFVWAWHRLALPIAMVTWFYAISQRNYFRRVRRVSAFHFWFTAVAMVPVLIVFSAGLVAIVNCVGSSSTPITIEGSIKKLHSHKGRFGYFYSATIKDERTSKNVTLVIASSDFSELVIGQTYRRDMIVGKLGIPFRRRS